MALPDEDPVADIGLVVMVVFLMMGMGASVDKTQAQSALANKRAILVGWLSQFVFMPCTAALLGVVFDLSPINRVSLIIVGCTPGGTTSQLFTYWSKGSVALSILMTLASTTCALFMFYVLFAVLVDPIMSDVRDSSESICLELMARPRYWNATAATPVLYDQSPKEELASPKPEGFPFAMPLACWETTLSPDEWACAAHYYSCTAPAGGMPRNTSVFVEGTSSADCLRKNVCSRNLAPNIAATATLLVQMLIAAAIGFLAREPPFGESAQSRLHGLRTEVSKFARKWLVCVGSSFGALTVVLLIAYFPMRYMDLIKFATWGMWVTSILIGVLGFTFGYFVARRLGFSIRVARTISLETGIQNGPLAILIVRAAFPHCAKGAPLETCAQMQSMIFPTFYSVFIVINALVVVFGLYAKIRPEPVQKIPAVKSRVAATAGPDDGAAPRASLFMKGEEPRAALTLPETVDTFDATGAAERRELTTLYDFFQRGVRLCGKRRCLGTRQETGRYEWLNYTEVDELVQQLAAGLVHACQMKEDDFLAIMSKNRAEWLIAAEACHAQSFVKVPLYDTLGDEAVEFIVNHTKLKVLVCAAEHKPMLSQLTAKCPSLKYIVVLPEGPMRSRPKNARGSANVAKIVVLDDIDGDAGNAAAGDGQEGIVTLTFDQVLNAGAEHPIAPNPPSSADKLSLICYTSGTTGMPKGAMLSHGNIVANVAAMIALDDGLRETRPGGFVYRATDVHMSFLPLAHIMEQFTTSLLMCVGGSVGFYSGSIPGLMEDIAELRPTLFMAVPRLLNRMHDKVMAKVEAQRGCCGNWPPPCLNRKMFKWGYAKKKSELSLPSVEHGFWDSSVFSTVARRLGGRVRSITTGAAPISKDVMDFLRICFSCDVFEGYGQTESTAAITLSYPGDTSTGNAGVPVPSNVVKLVDVEEMEYTTKDKPCPRGEVCCRGPNVFKGYFKDKAKTDEALDADGWLHTGDIGRWNADGTLTIIDRKKNIFKLAQGEYVAAEKIENVMLASQYIQQVFIYGDSLKHQLVSVTVPDHEPLGDWARSKGLSNHPPSEPGVDDDGVVAQWFKDVCALDEVKELIASELARCGKEAGLKGFEKPKETLIEHEPFTSDNGLLTPTLKPKRPQLRKHYHTQIDAMYAALEKKAR
eukprot:g5444.t1